MARLDGKVALVTGGARGIGRGIALAFAREGAAVGVNDRRHDEELEQVVDEVRRMRRQAWALAADVSDDAAVHAMVTALLEQAGRIDILVTNAGIADLSPVAEMPVEVWDRMIAVHLRGTFLCTHDVLPSMLARGEGTIITIGSQLGQIGRENWTHYCAAKGGIIAFTKALAREVGPRGIRVNCIAPGPIQTGLVSAAITPPEPSQEGASVRLQETLPLRRLGEVEDVAPTTVFLASADARYYAGQTLGPHGGDVMLWRTWGSADIGRRRRGLPCMRSPRSSRGRRRIRHPSWGKLASRHLAR